MLSSLQGQRGLIDARCGSETAPLAWKVGQMLAIGFPSGEDGFGILEAVLEKTLAGNLILFARNGSDAKTAAVSAARARNLVFAVTGTEPLVAIDQEGGTVSRIRKGLTPIPGAMAQSAAFLGGGAMLSDIEELGEVCGAELYSLGINWNLAPVTDVNVNPLNPVIGVRSYGEDPCLVAAMTSAFARGLAKSGVVATAKHFPGHGDTVQDSHLDLPLVPHGFPRLDDVELLPFKRLIVEGIPTIMTAHLRFSVVEPDPLPATLSPRVLRGLLRGELGFSGLICSDCMEMKAIADRHADPYIRAVEAGVDLLFVNHTAEAQKRAAASLLEALASGRISEARIDESVARILELKARYTGQLGGVRERPSSSRAAAISIASLTILHSSSLAVGAEGRLAAGKLRLIVDFAPTNSSEMEDRSDSPSVSGELAASSIPSLRLSSDPGESEVSRALGLAGEALRAQAGEAPALALVLSAPFARKGQGALLAGALDLSATLHHTLLVALMCSPYDLRGVLEEAKKRGAPEPLVLCSYEYSAQAATVLAAFLQGLIPAKGRCPVHPLAEPGPQADGRNTRSPHADRSL